MWWNMSWWIAIITNLNTLINYYTSQINFAVHIVRVFLQTRQVIYMEILEFNRAITWYSKTDNLKIKQKSLF
jgi:hypothetical protein